MEPPNERHIVRSTAYTNPEGFVEVTADNQNTPVSEHFRLRDFLTHDQVQVWPKYLVLREPLVDKLELVIAELASRYLDRAVATARQDHADPVGQPVHPVLRPGLSGYFLFKWRWAVFIITAQW